MTAIQNIFKRAFNAARQGRLFLLSALLSIPIAFIASIVLFTVLGRKYSITLLAIATAAASILIFWIVWFILSKFSKRIKTNPLVFSWRVYLLAGIVLCTTVFFAWNRTGTKIINPPNYRHEVEITSSNHAPGIICVLDIKNENGEKIEQENGAITGLALTGDWVSGREGCQFLSPASAQGSVKFSHIGPIGEVLHLFFQQNKGAGAALIRIDGKPSTPLDLYREQEGTLENTLPLGPTFILLTWNILGTAGWIAVLAIVWMVYVILPKENEPVNIPLPAPVTAGLDFLKKYPWVMLAPIAVAAIFMFWPPGTYVAKDSSYYLSLAKNLFHGMGYVNQDLSPAIYRGPVFPLLISLSYSFFGDFFRSALIMVRIFWILTILISYLLGKQLYNPRTGLLAALFVLAAGVINTTFYYIWTDGMLAFAILALQLVFWEAFKNQRGVKWYVLMGFLMGMAYLLKQTALFIVPLPLLTWAIISEYRTRQNLLRLLICYLVFSFFFFGWMGYVYLAGGSPGQVTRDLRIGASVLSYITRFTSFISSGHVPATQTGIATSQSMSFLQMLEAFYVRDIVPYFRTAIIFPIALAYTLFLAIFRKNKADIFVSLGLLLFSSLIPVNIVVDFGFRQNLYFYCILMLCLAAMIDRLFGKLTTVVSNSFVLVAAAVLVIVQLSGGYYANLPVPIPVKNQTTWDLFANSIPLATWVDKHIQPDEKILIESRDSEILHTLTAGNRHFEFINTCIGETSFEPAIRCTPPYISFWIYQGATDPDSPRDTLQGVSEASLLATIREKGVKYVLVTPSIYSLYYYLKVHPSFEEIATVGHVVIFRVIAPVQPLSSYPNMKWETCLGKGTPEYLKNLRKAYPARFETKLRDVIEPWMGLSRQDITNFENWQGCEFRSIYPGTYTLP